MSSCPVCQNSVLIEDKHKGSLFTCSHCQATYFIDFQGQPEAPLPPEPEPLPEVAFQPPAEAIAPTASYDQPDPYFQQLTSSPRETQESQADLNPQGWVSDSAEGAIENENPSWNQSLPETDRVPPVAQVETPENFSDVVEYGNQDEVIAGLTYELNIYNINSKVKTRRVMEVLSEPRLRIDTVEVESQLQKIDAQQIQLKKLSALQTSVIVNALKGEDLTFHWSQVAL